MGILVEEKLRREAGATKPVQRERKIEMKKVTSKKAAVGKKTTSAKEAKASRLGR